MPLSERRIGISLLAFSPHREAGAGIYTLGLIRALTSRAPNNYTVFVPSQCQDFWRGFLPSSVNLIVCGPDPARRILRVVFEQTRLPRIALKHQVNTLYFPHFFAPRWRKPRPVVTVYDLLLLSKQTDFGWHKRLYYRWVYQNVSQRAAHVVTISEFSRRDIMHRLGLTSGSVSVVSPGVDLEFVSPQASHARLLDLPERYLLSVGGAYPHKRLPVLLDAFVQLSREISDLHLVVAGTYVGNRGTIRSLLAAASRMGLGGRVQTLPKLPRAVMPELFTRASALVSASEFEGFGIPVIEAMAVGCPVAASPAEAVAEVLGGLGWLAADFSATALAMAVRDAMSARRLASNILRSGMDRALSKYSWEASADTMEAILSTSG